MVKKKVMSAIFLSFTICFITILFIKVHIFWEGHKILRNLYLTFDYSTYIQSKVRWRFCKIMWPSQNIWTLIEEAMELSRILLNVIISNNIVCHFVQHFHLIFSQILYLRILNCLFSIGLFHEKFGTLINKFSPLKL